MVKFGKQYRENQLIEFNGNYIDYKKLKQKIKQLKEFFSSMSNESFSGKTLKNLLQIYMPTSVGEDENES